MDIIQAVTDTLADTHLLWWDMEAEYCMALLEKDSKELQKLQQTKNSPFSPQELTLM